ncbi:hypothetical protein NLX62_07780, partial [Mycobacteriaceae bacterium Msp059]|nr:hypothetical protein [Mycobacteriaceae bacterium Msp059]
KSEVAKPVKAESSTDGKPGGSRLSSAVKKLSDKVKGSKSKAGSSDAGDSSASDKSTSKSENKHAKKASGHKSAA